MSAEPLSYAIVLTDIVDSTSLSSTLDPQALAQAWARHDRLARDLLRLHGGREIDKADGMLTLFEHAGDAARFALDYHRVLAEQGLPFKARAGLHHGPLVLRENSAEDVALGAKPLEVEGLAKAMAARIASVAPGGRTLISGAARAALQEEAEPVHTHAWGHWRLQGVEQPVEVHELCAGAQTPMPPPDAAKAYRVVRHEGLWLPVREVRHSLPAERDGFVGRERALQALAARVEGGARLVSLLGLGGIGKTRLALRFGRGWAGEFPGGVWFCDLAHARTQDDLLHGVAQGLGLVLSGRDPVQQVAHALAGRGRCLVVLDNFEQLAAWAEPTVGRWLEQAGEAVFLVTTRAVLDIAGEDVLALPPLGVEEAQSLFLLRVRSQLMDYAPAPEEQAAIRELLQQLEGLPLAIELAAARARVMSPTAILARLHERFELLRRSGRHDRQSAMRTAFDWSWDLLEVAERRALAQASVFRGGFTLEAAEAVIEAHPVLDVLQGLVDKSLLRVDEQGRFRMLEMVREYAGEQLGTEGRFEGSGPQGKAAAERRHAVFFGGLGPRRAIERACVESDNLVTACRRSVACGDGGVAARVLDGMWAVIERQGPFRLGVELAEAVLGLDGLSPEDRLIADRVAVGARFFSGELEQPEQRMARLLQEAVRLGDRSAQGSALHVDALRRLRSGEAAGAAERFEQALAAFRDTGDLSRQCAVLNSLGGLKESWGRAEEARALFESALALAGQAGDRRWQGGSAGNLAQFHANQGSPEKAQPLYLQAIAIAVEIGDRQWEANNRCNFGLLHFAQGRLREAGEEMRSAIEAARELGHRQLLCIAQCNLGLVLEAMGELDEASSRFEAAVHVAHSLGDRRTEGQCLGYLGTLNGRRGRSALALQQLDAGEALLRAVADPCSLGILSCGRAEAHWHGGDMASAERALAQARELAQQLGGAPAASELGQALSRAASLAGLTALSS